MDLWGGIILTGSICTLYCTLVGIDYLYMALTIITWLNTGSAFAVCATLRQGGLKAVVWTDVFQVGEKNHSANL